MRASLLLSSLSWLRHGGLLDSCPDDCTVIEKKLENEPVDGKNKEARSCQLAVIHGSVRGTR